MLKIRKVKRYSIARYPREHYRPRRPGAAESLVVRGGLSVFLATILEACDGVGVTGPPPVVPEFITENEARWTVYAMFEREGVELTPTWKSFRFGELSVELELDGFNDSLQVGYEYLSDEETMSPEARRAFADAIGDGGPYVKVLDRMRGESAGALEDSVEAFIDTLKAYGVI